MELVNQNIFIISPNHWGEMHISKHHYAIELAKRGNQVHFISPPSLNHKLFELEEITTNLKVIKYYPIFRGKSILPSSIFDLLIKLQIFLLIKKIGIKPDIVWSFTSTIYFNLNWFKAKFKIYHPMDQLNSINAVNIGDTANIIFTCSDYMLNELKQINTPKHTINHGLSPSFLKFNFPIKTKNKAPQIGYVGNLFMKNLDRELLQNLILKNPNHHFNFYGAYKPEKSNISAWVSEKSLDFVQFLLSSKNVTCHGSYPSSIIPEKISNIDVFLVCYLKDNENIISNSHKILEYLSTGKVVISSYIEHYKDSLLIEMCQKNSNSQFNNLYSKVLENLHEFNSLNHQERRKEFAANNSYEKQIDRIEKLIINLELKVS